MKHVQSKTRRFLPWALSLLTAATVVLGGIPFAVSAPPAKAPAKVEKIEKTTEKATVKPAEASEKPAKPATDIEALSLVKEPTKYMNQRVSFTGTFNRFSDVGLDYKPAFRDSRDYVTFLILRPDAGAHKIPLSELKLFFPRKKSDDVMDIETGDRIKVTGTEFSTALGEPWLDIDNIEIVEKTHNPERKHDAPEL